MANLPPNPQVPPAAPGLQPFAPGQPGYPGFREQPISWSEWFMSFFPADKTKESKTRARKQMKPTDAVHSEALRNRFNHFLDNIDPPTSFKASDVAKELRLSELYDMGYEEWSDALPAVIELAFELREAGYCEIIQKGKVLSDDVGPYDIEGGVRIRRIDD